MLLLFLSVHLTAALAGASASRNRQVVLSFEHGGQNLVPIPGGSPFSYCAVSSPTDLYNISSIELWPQPLHIEEMFTAHIYGTYLKDITPNATVNVRYDCGSHCKEFGLNDTTGQGGPWPFCNMHGHTEQLQREIGCPPVKGWALTTTGAWAPQMYTPVPTWYNFTFDAITAEGERIYCITAEVCLRWEDGDKNNEWNGPGSNCTWPR